MNRKIKLGFLISLIVNVILVGTLIGQWPRRSDRDRQRQQRIDETLKGLPSQAQATLRDRLQQLRAAAEPFFTQARAAESAVIDQLGQNPFDEAAYDSKLNKVADIRKDMIEKLGQVVKNQSKDLSPDERSKFAELLRRPPSR